MILRVDIVMFTVYTMLTADTYTRSLIACLGVSYCCDSASKLLSLAFVKEVIANLLVGFSLRLRLYSSWREGQMNNW